MPTIVSYAGLNHSCASGEPSQPHQSAGGGFMSYLNTGANASADRDASSAPLQGMKHFAGGSFSDVL
jgi:hypothetical protein